MNTLKKLQFYMGKRKVLMPIALTLSGLSGLLSLCHSSSFGLSYARYY